MVARLGGGQSARVSDTTLYGNAYPLAEMLTDLTEGVFPSDRESPTSSLQRNLQIEYVSRLARIANAKQVRVLTRDPLLLWPTSQKERTFDHLSQSSSLYQLQRIADQLSDQSGRGTDTEQIAHRNHLKLLIDRALAVDGPT